MDHYTVFEWDEAKSERNRIKRDLPFRVVVALFAGFAVTSEDTRRDYGERRMQVLGMVDDQVLQCVYTMRGDVCRVISVRRASRKERNGYYSCKPG